MSNNKHERQPIDRDTMKRALHHLGDLLQENNTKLELLCCGGIVSQLYLNSR